MIKIQLDPNGKEKLQEAAKKSAQQGKTAVRWLGRKIKQLKPTRKTVLKGGVLALLLGVATAAQAGRAKQHYGGGSRAGCFFGHQRRHHHRSGV